MLRHLTIVTLSLLCLLPLSFSWGQNREVLGEYRVGLIGRDQGDSIYLAVRKGAEAAVAELSERYSIDIELLEATPDRSEGEDQVLALGRLLVEAADGLVISPDASEAVEASLAFARGEGQEIVFFERKVPGLEVLAAYLADEREAGRLAGQSILKELPERSRVAILTSSDPGPTLEARLEGLRSVLGFRRIERVVTCEPDYRSAIGAVLRAEEEDRNDLIGGWVFLEDWPLLGMPAFPWEPGRIPAVAIQSTPSAFMYVDDEYIDALVVHPYFEWGYQSVVTLVEKLHNDAAPESTVQSATPRMIDWRNVDAYREDWKRWLR